MRTKSNVTEMESGTTFLIKPINYSIALLSERLLLIMDVFRSTNASFLNKYDASERLFVL